MSRPSIEQLRGLGDFQNLFNWNLYVDSFPAAVDAEVGSEGLNLRCVSSEVPKRPGTSQEIIIRGHSIYQPGIYKPNGTITLTMLETVDNAIKNLLKSWQEACWEPGTGVQQPKADVEAVVRLVQLNRQDEEVWQYRMIGCYLQDCDFTGGTLSETGADVSKPTLILQFDDFTQEALA